MYRRSCHRQESRRAGGGFEGNAADTMRMPMSVPPRFTRVLAEHGVAADTRLRLEDLYYSLGSGVMDALAELAERRSLPARDLRPEHLEELRPILGESFLARHHPEWLQGVGSRGFWQDRRQAGAIGGSLRPLGLLDDGEQADFTRRVFESASTRIAEGQPRPRGLLLLGLDAHSGGRPGTFSFELIPRELEAALILNACAGRQHTSPGAIGETSGSLLADGGPAVVWEVQPNVYKPTAERNRPARRVAGKFRSWPIVTTVAAFTWLRDQGRRVFVLRPEGLRPAHVVETDDKPLSDELLGVHERNVRGAAEALGLKLEAPPVDFDCFPLAQVVSTPLERALRTQSGAALFWELTD